MKIISLQSIGLGDYDPTIEGTPQPLVIEINHNYPYSGRRVESIELVAGGHTGIPDLDSMGSMESLYYRVTTSDGHVRMLLERAYIAEWAGETND